MPASSPAVHHSTHTILLPSPSALFPSLLAAPSAPPTPLGGSSMASADGANGKVVLLTGANSGIGYALTLKLLAAGYTTYATARSTAKANDLVADAKSRSLADRLHIVEMDVSADASVADGVAAVLAATDGVLDVVISNAGYGNMAPPEAAAPADYAANFNTNVLGTVRLATATLPTMRARGGGRFIATSSVAGLVGLPLSPVLVATKHALEGLIECHAVSYAGTGVRFSLVEPGPVATAAVDNAHGLDAEIVPELRAAAKAFGSSWWGTATPQTADDCAAYFMRAVTDADPALRYVTFAPVMDLLRVKYADVEGRQAMAALQELVTESGDKE